MRTGLATLVAAAALASAAPAAAIGAAEDPAVTNATVRLPAASGRPAAGFFTLKAGSINDALVGATSPKAQRIEMHSMTMTDGVMRMRAEPSFPLPLGSTLAFKPGGNHLMLFGLAPGIKPGDTVPITLSFKSGSAVLVNARAEAPGAPSPKPKGHQH